MSLFSGISIKPHQRPAQGRDISYTPPEKDQGPQLTKKDSTDYTHTHTHTHTQQTNKPTKTTGELAPSSYFSFINSQGANNTEKHNYKFKEEDDKISSISSSSAELYRPPNLQISDFNLSPNTNIKFYPTHTSTHTSTHDDYWNKSYVPQPEYNHTITTDIKGTQQHDLHHLIDTHDSKESNASYLSMENDKMEIDIANVEETYPEPTHSYDPNLENPNFYENNKTEGTPPEQSQSAHIEYTKLDTINTHKTDNPHTKETHTIKDEDFDDDITHFEMRHFAHTQSLIESYDLLLNEHLTSYFDSENHTEIEKGLYYKISTLEAQQNIFVKNEEFIEADQLDSEIKQIRMKILNEKSQLIESLNYQIKLYPQIFDILESYDKSLQDVINGAKDLQLVQTEKSNNRIKEILDYLENQKTSLSDEIEKSQFNTHSINEEKTRLEGEIKKIFEIIENQTVEIRNEIEEANIEERELEKSIKELEEKLNEKNTQLKIVKQKKNFNLSKLDAIKSKYQKQLNRIEQAEHIVAQSLRDISEDEKKIELLEQTIIEQQDHLNTLNQSCVKHNQQFQDFIYKGSNRMKILCNLKEKRKIINESLNSWTQAVLCVRVELQAILDAMQSKIKEIQLLEVSREETREFIKSFENILPIKISDKKAAIQSRSYKEATLINSEIKKLENDLELSKKKYDGLQLELINLQKELRLIEENESNTHKKFQSENHLNNKQLLVDLSAHITHIQSLDTSELCANDFINFLIEKEISYCSTLQLAIRENLNSVDIKSSDDTHTHCENTHTHCENTPTHCENTPTHCENTHTHCENTHTHCENTHTHCENTPTHCENTPTHCENTHTHCENTHTHCENTHTHCENTPTQCVNTEEVEEDEQADEAEESENIEISEET